MTSLGDELTVSSNYNVYACFIDYLDKLHRRGNKLILVHGIELPELSLHNASEHRVFDLHFLFKVFFDFCYQ